MFFLCDLRSLPLTSPSIIPSSATQQIAILIIMLDNWQNRCHPLSFYIFHCNSLVIPPNECRNTNRPFPPSSGESRIPGACRAISLEPLGFPRFLHMLSESWVTGPMISVNLWPQHSSSAWPWFGGFETGFLNLLDPHSVNPLHAPLGICL